MAMLNNQMVVLNGFFHGFSIAMFDSQRVDRVFYSHGPRGVFPQCVLYLKEQYLYVHREITLW